MKKVLVPSTGNLYIYRTPRKHTVEIREFSSPPRGIYISTRLCCTYMSLLRRSRPLHGESIYLRRILRGKRVPYGVLVPSTGNLYIYKEDRMKVLVEIRSRPLHGESIYLRYREGARFYPIGTFSSPPRGIYISTYVEGICAGFISFSSPPRGIYISTMRYILTSVFLPFSSPPRGIYISTIQKILKEKSSTVLVPSTGNLYIYKSKIKKKKREVKVLVPSTGNLYIYTKKCWQPQDSVSSRPLHGESIYLP